MADTNPINTPSTPKPIKMLEVEKMHEPVNKPEPAIEPLPIDTTDTTEPVAPIEPIDPNMIEKTPRDAGGESGSSPLRSDKMLASFLTRARGQ